MQEDRILPKDVERFALPTSIKNGDLCKCIEDILSEDIQKNGACNDSVLEGVANEVYEKKAHNGSNIVNNDKNTKIIQYKNYLNENGLTEDQKQFLRNTYFRDKNDFESQLQKGNITNEVAGWLWCFYQQDNQLSLAAQYENNLRNRIKDYVQVLLASLQKSGARKHLY